MMKQQDSDFETTVCADGTQWGVCKAGGGDLIADCFGPNQEKNARLFAAAPKLFDAARVIQLAPAIRSWLMMNDRKALEQLDAAIEAVQGEPDTIHVREAP